METVRPLEEEGRPSPYESKISLRTSLRYLDRLNARLETIRRKKCWDIAQRLKLKELNGHVDGLTQLKPHFLLLEPFRKVAEGIAKALKDAGLENDGVRVRLSTLVHMWYREKVEEVSTEYGRRNLSKRTDVEGKTRRKLHRHHPYYLSDEQCQIATDSRRKTVSEERSIRARIAEARHRSDQAWEGATAKSRKFDQSNSWPQEDAYAEDRAWERATAKSGKFDESNSWPTKRRSHRHHPYYLSDEQCQIATDSRRKTVSEERSIRARIAEARYRFDQAWEGATAKPETFDESNSRLQEDVYAEDRVKEEATAESEEFEESNSRLRSETCTGDRAEEEKITESEKSDCSGSRLRDESGDARELGVEKSQTICFDDTVEWMEDALEDYILAESREEEWWNDLQRDIDEIHSLISENELSEPWLQGRTSSPNEDEHRKEGLDENNNENAHAYPKLNKLEPNPTYKLPELSPRALRHKEESRLSLAHSENEGRSKNDASPLESLEEEETDAEARILPETVNDDEKKSRDLVQDTGSETAVRGEEEVQVQANEVFELEEIHRSRSEPQAVGRVQDDLRTTLYGKPMSDSVKGKNPANFGSVPTVLGHWSQTEEEVARLFPGTARSPEAENYPATISEIFSCEAEKSVPLTKRTLSTPQLGSTQETSNNETLNDAIKKGNDSFAEKSDRIGKRWTSSLTNILLFFRGRSKRSQEEKRESLARSHRKTKWKEKFTGPWRMWEKRIESRHEHQRLDCTCSPKSKMKPCGVTCVQAKHEQVLQKRDLPRE